MKQCYRTRFWLPAVLGATLAAGAPSAYGQFGGQYSRGSFFVVPSQQLGLLGGRYSGRWEGSQQPQSASWLSGSYEAGPLSVDPSRGAFGSAGPVLESGWRYQPAQAMGLYSGSPRAWGAPLAMPIAAGLAVPWSRSAEAPLPAYRRPVRGRPPSLFDPTINADSFTTVEHRYQIDLQRLTPEGPTGSALIDTQDVRSAPPPAAADGARQTAPHELLSTLTAAKISQDGAACMAKAAAAYKEGDYRGAIGWFRTARLLINDRPEPLIGLMVSFVAAGDYQQAAVLIGPLVSRWPELLKQSNPFALLYDDFGQMRAHLVGIREVSLAHKDVDLRLLWVFYAWFAESRQLPLDIRQAAQILGPGSAPAVLADAMQAALPAGR